MCCGTACRAQLILCAGALGIFGPVSFMQQPMLSNQWSSSTLLEGVDEVVNQHGFLHSKSDQELEQELAAPWAARSLCGSMFDLRIRVLGLALRFSPSVATPIFWGSQGHQGPSSQVVFTWVEEPHDVDIGRTIHTIEPL